MSKSKNDGLTLSGTGCFIAVPICQQWCQRVNMMYKTVWKFSAVVVNALALGPRGPWFSSRPCHYSTG